ncbi:MAG: DUF1854 domain-containing protein [Longimicrobiales bacterium]
MTGTRFRTRAHPASESKSQPAGLTLERAVDGRLRAHVDDHISIVHVHRCFPWSAPERFISLRNADGEEIALVTDPAELTDHARAVLEVALAEASFVFDVEAVLEIEEEVELRSWRVHTHQGPRRFQTRLDDWPERLPGGGLLIRDVTGDFYRVGDVAALDRRSRSLLWAFVD